MKAGDIVSDKVVASLFQADGAVALNAARLQAAQAGISDPRFIPFLASVNFQLGKNWINTFPDIWNMILNGKYQEAADVLYGTIWASQSQNRVQDFQHALRSLSSNNHSKT